MMSNVIVLIPWCTLLIKRQRIQWKSCLAGKFVVDEAIWVCACNLMHILAYECYCYVLQSIIISNHIFNENNHS